MAKSLREQLLALDLVPAADACQAETVSRQRVNRECFKNAMKAVGRVDSDHREVVVEYRRNRAK